MDNHRIPRNFQQTKSTKQARKARGDAIASKKQGTDEKRINSKLELTFLRRAPPEIDKISISITDHLQSDILINTFVGLDKTCLQFGGGVQQFMLPKNNPSLREQF